MIARARAATGRSDLLALAVAVLLIPAALGSSATIFNDGDVSWHIATGQWILDHRAVPHTDPFSFTWGGKPWVAFEWLSDVLIGGAHRIASYAGVAALVTAALMTLHAIFYLSARKFLRPWFAVGALVAMDVVLIPMTLARPHLIAWPLVAFWTWLMMRAREQGRAPPLPAALLMIVWVNLHGSWAIGLLIAAAFGLEALLAEADKARVLRQWLVFGLACAAAVFVNANGTAGVFHPLLVANLTQLPLIDEWQPSNTAVTPFFFAILAAVLVLIALTRPRLHPVRWALLVFLLTMAMLQMRHQAIFAILTAMLLPRGFSRRTAAEPPANAILVGLAAVLLVAIRAAMPVSLPDNSANPWKLIAAVPDELRSQPVLNGYGMGGPLILSGIRPYVDGRGDMYGDELVAGYRRIVDGDPVALDEAVKRWGIRWAILPNRYAKITAELDRSNEWRRIYKDEVGAIYVRASSP